MSPMNKLVITNIKQRTKAALHALTDAELLEIKTGNISEATQARIKELDLVRLSDLFWAVSTPAERTELIEIAQAGRDRKG